MEIALAGTAVALFFLGHELSLLLWRSEEGARLEPLERVCSASVIALALWLGSLWIFALTGTLTGLALVVRFSVVLAVAVMLRRLRLPPPHEEAPRVAGVLAVVLLPLAIWIGFILWRGWVTPPVTHDALAYHLPKAVLFARAHAYEYLSLLDPIIRKLPANYELLLSDVILTTGTDRATEWVSTMFFVLFLVACIALAQRWWKANAAADSATALLIASAPVLILHSGAHKNDLMVGFFLASALIWCGRVVSERSFPSAVLLALSVGMSIGTKPQAGLLAVAAAVATLYAIVRLPPRKLVAVVAVSVAAIILLGGAVYAINIWNETPIGGQAASHRFVKTILYGDWANLWQAPWVLLAAPFSPSSMRLSVPWEDTPWFWRRYEIYFSHLGIPFSLAVLLLPVGVALTRKSPRRNEVLVVGLVAFTSFFVMLPVVSMPHGVYTISLPRYALFIVPVVFAAGVAPLLRMVPARLTMATTFAAALVFVAYAVDTAAKDTFVPLRFVSWAARHPGTRVVPFDSRRAALVADQLAGPDDVIAVYAGYGTWIHPAFGRQLSRPVELISADAREPVVSRDVRWLVVDRGVESVWSHPDFKDLSQARQFIARGRISPETQAFIDAAMRLPDFRAVYLDLPRGQAVFQRVTR